MADIVLFHSILGLRPAEHEVASILEADGHAVTLPDLFGGQTAETYDEGFALKDRVGDKLILMGALKALDKAPDAAVLAGISFGAFLVGQLWGGRPKMKGALLIAGVAPWTEHLRPGLPVQAHISQPDPFDDEEFFEEWMVRAGQASCEMYRYTGVGHYFLDRSLPDFDVEASDQCLRRAKEFLRSL